MPSLSWRRMRRQTAPRWWRRGRVEVEKRFATLHRAWVGRDGHRMKIEWAVDSGFRFFPVVEDPVLGYRLQDADLAVNKVLAGAGRVKIRDYLDLVHLEESGLALGALAWAATGKDPGMAPLLVIDELSRNARYYRPEELSEVGCLYLNAAGSVVTPDPDSAGFARLKRHFGSWRGSWPRVVE